MVTRILRDDPGKATMHNVRIFGILMIEMTYVATETSNIPEIALGESFRLRYVYFSVNHTLHMI